MATEDATGAATLEELLESLKLISILKPGQKVAATPHPLSLTIQDKSGGWFLAAMTRLWYADSRETTLRLLHTIFDYSFQCMETTLTEMEQAKSPPYSRLDTLARFRHEKLVTTLQAAIQAAVNGIVSLRETYSMDVNHLCKLMLLQEKIQLRLEEVNLSLQYLKQGQGQD